MMMRIHKVLQSFVINGNLIINGSLITSFMDLSATSLLHWIMWFHNKTFRILFTFLIIFLHNLSLFSEPVGLHWLIFCVTNILATVNSQLNYRGKKTSEYMLWYLISSRSLFCMLQGEAYMISDNITQMLDHIGEFGGKGNTLYSLSCSSNHCWTIFAVWQDASFCWKGKLPLGNNVAMKWWTCSAVMFRQMVWQSSTEMNARSQRFSAEHCLMHHTASAGLTSSNTAPCYHLFPT